MVVASKWRHRLVGAQLLDAQLVDPYVPTYKLTTAQLGALISGSCAHIAGLQLHGGQNDSHAILLCSDGCESARWSGWEPAEQICNFLDGAADRQIYDLKASSSRSSTPLCASDISPGRGNDPPPTSDTVLAVWCGERYGRCRQRAVSMPPPVQDATVAVSSASSSVASGRMPGNREASSVLPQPGLPISNR